MIPSKLSKDPIVEALFEIRFQSTVKAVSNLLPAFLYTELKNDFEAPERLPIAEFPEEFIALDPNLKYQPRLRMRGAKFSMLIGDSSIVLSCPRPYVGWNKYKKMLTSLLLIIKETKLISVVDRFSFKYVNVLEADKVDEQFSLVKFVSKIGPYDLTKHLSSTKSEIREEGLINIIEVQSNAVITLPNSKETMKGLLLNVDTINDNPGKFWDMSEQLIEAAHTMEKKMFFCFLPDEVIKKFGAVYD